MELKSIVQPGDQHLRAVDILKKDWQISHQLDVHIRHRGALWINGKPARMIDPVQVGDLLTAQYEAPNEMKSGLRCQAASGVQILYEDDWVVVCHKPTPMLTHRATKDQKDSLAESLTTYTLHPVSRLDRQTSGLVVFAKNGYGHQRIHAEPMQKIYLALTYGKWPETGKVTLPIKRQEGSIILRETHPEGQAACTLFKTRSVWHIGTQSVSLVEFELITGRTHQIRVHAKAMRRPLIGDGLYGISSCDENLQRTYEQLSPQLEAKMAHRQALHAAKLSFFHPFTQENLIFEQPLPNDMRQTIDWLNLNQS